jgi:AraC-like DNA-binding protein
MRLFSRYASLEASLSDRLSENPVVNNPVVAFSLRDINDVDALTEKARIEIIQTKSGHFSGHVERFEFDNTTIIRLRLDLDCIVRATISPDRIMCALPVRWRGDLAFNGIPVRQDTLFRVACKEHWLSKGEGGRDVLFVLLGRRDVAKTIATQQVTSPDEVNLEGNPLVLPKAALERLTRRLATVLSDATKHQSIYQDSEAAREIARTVKTSMLDFMLCALPGPERLARQHRTFLQLVQKADARFLESLGHPIALVDQCQAVGTSATTLNAAFNSVCGMSPARYIKLRRLCRARQALMKADERRSAVKRAALGAGLTELGRFSVEYRALFGESPSTTVCRAIEARSRGEEGPKSIKLARQPFQPPSMLRHNEIPSDNLREAPNRSFRPVSIYRQAERPHFETQWSSEMDGELSVSDGTRHHRRPLRRE